MYSTSKGGFPTLPISKPKLLGIHRASRSENSRTILLCDLPEKKNQAGAAHNAIYIIPTFFCYVNNCCNSIDEGCSAALVSSSLALNNCSQSLGLGSDTTTQLESFALAPCGVHRVAGVCNIVHVYSGVHTFIFQVPAYINPPICNIGLPDRLWGLRLHGLSVSLIYMGDSSAAVGLFLCAYVCST